MNAPRRALPAALVLLLLTTLAPTYAWAPQTRVHMLDEAVKFMPPTLRTVLEEQRESLLRGALETMKLENGSRETAPWLGGKLDSQVEAEAAKLAALLKEPKPLDQVARQFGRLAHYILDAGFPPGATADGDARYDHFSKFCESRRERFPLVFYGHEHEALGKSPNYAAYALDVLERARQNDRKIAYTYERAAKHAHADDFDDRSVPFAVGSLSYSRSINDVVRVWLTVWENAHGDMGYTPYRNVD